MATFAVEFAALFLCALGCVKCSLTVYAGEVCFHFWFLLVASIRPYRLMSPARAMPPMILWLKSISSIGRHLVRMLRCSFLACLSVALSQLRCLVLVVCSLFHLVVFFSDEV